jgi:hypothetical protein
MRSVSYQCPYCGRQSEVPVALLLNAHAVRCIRCSALTGISERQREDLLNQAITGVAPPDGVNLRPSELKS